MGHGQQHYCTPTKTPKPAENNCTWEWTHTATEKPNRHAAHYFALQSCRALSCFTGILRGISVSPLCRALFLFLSHAVLYFCFTVMPRFISAYNHAALHVCSIVKPGFAYMNTHPTGLRTLKNLKCFMDAHTNPSRKFFFLLEKLFRGNLVKPIYTITPKWISNFLHNDCTVHFTMPVWKQMKR